MREKNTLVKAGRAVLLLSFVALGISLLNQFGFIDLIGSGTFLIIALAGLAISMMMHVAGDYYKPGEALTMAFRIFVGVLFIFSGFVKSIDPLGTAYKITEYFVEFGLGFFEPFTLAMSVFMIVLEIVLGITLLLGYMRNWTLRLLLLLILFFTFLTGYTTVTGNVTDCGCFGDFLKLEPFQSFIKDLVLLVMILVLYYNKKYIKPFFSTYIAGPISVLATLFFTWFCFSNFYFDLPAMDFRPYKPGKNIPEQMTVPKDKQPIVEFVFTYKNKETGEEKEFNANNMPSGDKWEFVDRKDIVIKEGETPPINNFSIVNKDGESMDDEILYNPDYVFMVVAYDLRHTAKEAFIEKINPLAEKAQKAGYMFFTVTSTSPESFEQEIDSNHPFYLADDIFLKTIVRSNPGLVILKDGNVLMKWHHRHIPDYEEINSNYLK
ncbi:MAG: BT_3928 family protein [Chitinophagales bacterium]